jgi:hypothetical protein
MGIGTLWGPSFFNLCTNAAYNANTKAAARFQTTSDCPATTKIPADDKCGHWRRDCFTLETMRPAISVDSVISEVTAASLEDMGYGVDYSSTAAPKLGPGCPKCSRRLGGVGRDEEVSAAPPRRLSEEGRAAAITVGLNHLAAQAEEFALYSETAESSLDGTMEYVGHLVVAVMILEDGELFDFIVTADDAFPR